MSRPPTARAHHKSPHTPLSGTASSTSLGATVSRDILNSTTTTTASASSPPAASSPSKPHRISPNSTRSTNNLRAEASLSASPMRNSGNNNNNAGSGSPGETGSNQQQQQGGSSLLSVDQHHHHHHHQPRKSAHFVLDHIKLKRVAVISSDMIEHKMAKFDSVTNTVSIPPAALASLAAAAANKQHHHDHAATSTLNNALLQSDASVNNFAASSSVTNFDKTVTSGGGGAATNVSSPNTANSTISAGAATATGADSTSNNNSPSGTNTSVPFNEVCVVNDAFGAAAEIQMEVDKFFETGAPLVGSDTVPDADALVVVSAGPDGKTAAKATLSALEASTRYMAHRSLCVHVSAIAIYGNLTEMLNGCIPPEVQIDPSFPVNSQDVIAANVTMTDLMEHGTVKNHRHFSVSEPQEPFWDRYSPRHAQRLGMSSDDIDDKMTQLRLTVEDQLVKNHSRALAFMFLIDSTHFRDGYHRFTSDTHVAVQSQHPSSSLFFSRTTVLATRAPQIATTLLGSTAALPEAALAQPWTTSLRHLGAEVHHVLAIVACVPDANQMNDAAGAEAVTSVDDLCFDTLIGALKPETAEARDAAVSDLKHAFEVSSQLSRATSAKSGREPLPEHVFPKRTHVKLPEYVAALKRSHDELTNDQKTRHSVAKASLNYLSSQVRSPEDVAAVSAAGGFANDNRGKFAAIFRAAFMKQKVQEKVQEEQLKNASFVAPPTGTAAKDGQQQQQQQQNAPTVRKSPSLGGPIFAADPAASGDFSTGGGGFLSPDLLHAHTSAAAAASGQHPHHHAASSKDMARLRQQNDALALIKERLEFDLAKLDKETRRLRSDLTVSQTRRKKTERELSEAQGRALAAETSAQKVRTEANTECLELRQKLVNLQLQIDALGRRNEQMASEMELQRIEAERQLRASNEQHQRKFRDLEADLAVAQNEKQVLQHALEEHTRRIHALEEQVVRVEVDKKDLTHQLAESREAIELAKAEARRTVEKASRVRRAEREEYLRLLESGRAATEELVMFEDLRVDKVCANESVYRAGADGVRAWLNAIGQGQYSSVMERGGFTDVLSIANVHDRDLSDLKILAGHRRRIIASAAELRAQLHLATAKRRSTMPPIAEETTLDRLVEGLRLWFRDFESVVRAESVDGAADAV